MPVAFVPSTPAPTHPGRFRAAGVPGALVPGGVPFLTAQFPTGRVWVEAAFGANLTASPDSWPWVDITADVMYEARLRMRVGRADDTSQAQSAGCGFDLLNTSAAYSAYNPAGQYWPNVARNTPIRVRIDLGSGPSVAWQGYAVGWTPSWDTSAQRAIVTVVAAGMLRRLGQGNSPIRSSLTRSILKSTAATLRYYWPVEDASGSASAASAISGGPAMQTSGTVAFAAYDWTAPTAPITLLPGTTFGSAPTAQLNGGGSLTASFTPVLAGSGWTVQASINMDPATGANNATIVLLAWTEGGRLWQLVSDGITTDTIRLVVNGATVATEPHIMFGEDCRIDAIQSGGNINFTFKPMLSHTAITGSFAGTLAGVDSITANPNNFTGPGDLTVSHMRIWDANTADNFKTSTLALSAWNGWKGETASARLARLCAEEGIQLDLIGTSATTMGLQPLSTLVSVIRECEAADGGVLYDGFGPGLGYLCRSARYNLPAAVTIDASAGQLSPPFVPVDDDQRLRNDVTVTRTSGSSARYVDTDGPLGTTAVGTYDTSIPVNTYTDTPLAHIAAWEVALGTVPGLRYPNLPVDFAAVPALAQSWISNSRPAFRADVTNIDAKATQHPPDDVSLVVEGWSMNLDQVRWDVAASCSQFAPWRVATVGGTALVVGSSSTRTTTDMPAAATGTFDFASTRAWSSTAGDYPVDLNIGGERVTCSGVTGTTFTISARSVNGVVKAHPAGETVDVWAPARVAR